MPASDSLFGRLVETIRETFNRDDLRMIVVSCLDRTFDWLVAEKSLRDQVLELLLTMDEAGEVPALLACLCNEREGIPSLADLLKEVGERQEQIGQGRPIFAAEANRRTRVTIPLRRPPRVEHFTGRADELARLLADLQPGKVVTLCGPGGMGKTALAAEAVWRLAPHDDPPARFPDGVLFHTFYHQPQADVALETIARAYGVDLRPNAQQAARLALSNRKALLILDGAEAADDLPAVLSVAGSCGVLITTRRHKQAPAGYQDIEPLPRGESLSLLRGWAGAYADNDAAANEIVRLLGGLPLALFLVGRYLVSSKQQAADYAAWLGETGLAALHFENRPSESVPLLLARSLDQVSKAARRAFGVAGILAIAPFDAETVAAALATEPPLELLQLDLMLGVKLQETRSPNTIYANQSLGELVNYGLLLRPDARYQVTHALAHSYTRTHAAPEGETVARLALHYAALAERESKRGPAGFAVLDDHRAHIVAVQAAALAAEQWEAVRQTAWWTKDYLDLKGYWVDYMSVLRAGSDSAHALSDRYSEGVFLGELGIVFKNLGKYSRAIELYEQALQIAREIGDRGGESHALGNLGVVYRSLGEIKRAIEYLEQDLVICSEIGGQRGAGAALSNLGNAYYSLGNISHAIALYEQALAIDRTVGDRRGEGTDMGCLGTAYAALGETHRAIKYHEQRLAIAQELSDRRGEANALGDLGNTYIELGETHRAIEYQEQYLTISREIGDSRGEGAALNNLGVAYGALGETHRAIGLYERALLVGREIGDRRGEGNALGNLGTAYLTLGDTRRAIELFEQRLLIDRETGDRRREGNALGNLGTAYATLGNISYATELYDRQLVIMHEIGDRRGEAIASWNLGLAYAELGDLAGAIAYMQVLVAYYEEIGHPDAAKRAQRVAELQQRAGL